MSINLSDEKRKYIPLVAQNKLSLRKAAKLIGITHQSVIRLKRRYLLYGDKIFIHGNVGNQYHKKFDYKFIKNWYKKNFDSANFSIAYNVFCLENSALKISYTTFLSILKKENIKSPKSHRKKQAKKHEPRAEREHEGELIQIDASSYDWFMNGKKLTLHGAIDDATHKITALYFCKNECLLGYYQILQQTSNRMNGLPKEIYSDRSSCFCVTKNSLSKVSLQEQLDGITQAKTKWQNTCDSLGIQLIFAYSPQAKGRIERLWETLQGQLPFLFRYKSIKTIEQANKFLLQYMDFFNNIYSIEAKNKKLMWKRINHNIDLNYLFSVKVNKQTSFDGSFIYHGYKFCLCTKYKSYVKFTLCLSESFGIKAFLNGKYYDVSLLENISDVYGDQMPDVEKELIYKYFYQDTHSNIYKIV